jgi:hypothetical protein
MPPSTLPLRRRARAPIPKHCKRNPISSARAALSSPCPSASKSNPPRRRRLRGPCQTHASEPPVPHCPSHSRNLHQQHNQPPRPLQPRSPTPTPTPTPTHAPPLQPSPSSPDVTGSSWRQIHLVLILVWQPRLRPRARLRGGTDACEDTASCRLVAAKSLVVTRRETTLMTRTPVVVLLTVAPVPFSSAAPHLRHSHSHPR